MIAKEGLIFIFSGFGLTVVLILLATRFNSHWLFAVSLLMAILSVFTTYFFRDPNRTFDHQPGILVSPADGEIIGIETVPNEFIGGEAIKVSIFLSVFDVHVNRIPTDGQIDYVNYNEGKFFAAFKEKASLDNEQTEIGMTSATGHKLIFKQIAGLIARRIVCKLEEEDKVTAGDRFGLIRFGSRTELFVPTGSRLLVQLGDKVRGGESIIGYLPSEKGLNDVNQSPTD